MWGFLLGDFWCSAAEKAEGSVLAGPEENAAALGWVTVNLGWVSLTTGTLYMVPETQ